MKKKVVDESSVGEPVVAPDSVSPSVEDAVETTAPRQHVGKAPELTAEQVEGWKIAESPSPVDPEDHGTKYNPAGKVVDAHKAQYQVNWDANGQEPLPEPVKRKPGRTHSSLPNNVKY